MQTIKNQQGMSLVSVMVAIGLTGVLATILMNLSEQQAKQHKRAMSDAEMLGVLSQIQSVFVKGESCTSSLIGSRRGDELISLVLNEDPNAKPFVTVGEPVRSAKVVLKSIKILTKPEIDTMCQAYATPAECPYKSESGVVIVDVTMERPGNVQGAKAIRKQFEVRVLYGDGQDIISDDSQMAVINECKSTYGSSAFIQHPATLKRAFPEEEGVIPWGTQWFGHCVYPDDNNGEADLDDPQSIIECQTAD